MTGAADKAAKEATGWRDNNSTGLQAEAPAELQALRATMETWIHKQPTKTSKKIGYKARGRATFRHTQRPTRKILQLHEGS
jgi:hypothetical protein